MYIYILLRSLLYKILFYFQIYSKYAKQMGVIDLYGSQFVKISNRLLGLEKIRKNNIVPTLCIIINNK